MNNNLIYKALTEDTIALLLEKALAASCTVYFFGGKIVQAISSSRNNQNLHNEKWFQQSDTDICITDHQTLEQVRTSIMKIVIDLKVHYEQIPTMTDVKILVEECLSYDDIKEGHAHGKNWICKHSG